jgi:2-dehydro-3-deoxyphosphooctonate aldolase (KDO 8-P synthase)
MSSSSPPTKRTTGARPTPIEVRDSIEGLEILAAVKDQCGCAVLTDVHRIADIAATAQIVDVLQVPAFLSRQTSLLEAVGRTDRALNLKKGQFMSPQEMAGALAKVRGVGGDRVIVTERGTTFGYDRLVCDLTAVPRMQVYGCPVAVDAGHASNQPSDITVLAYAGVAAGADALYLECHPDPANARCDERRMLSLAQLEELLPRLVRIAEAVR